MSSTIEITILGKSYNVAAPSSEQVESLQTAARALDEKMKAGRAQNQTMSAEKLAVMVALNTMHALISQEADQGQSEATLASSLARLNSQLSEAGH